MTLSILLICLFIERYSVIPLKLNRFCWFEKVNEKICASLNIKKKILMFLFLISILFVLLTLFFILSLNNSIFLKTLISCFILVYSFGPKRTFLINKKNDDLINDNYEKSLSNFFIQVFNPIFLFVFLGPISSIFYRLIFLFSLFLKKKNCNTKLSKLIKITINIVHWISSRFLGIIYCLSGNFILSFNEYKKQVFSDFSSINNIVVKCGVLSINKKNNYLSFYNLIDRSIVIFLFFVILLKLN